jgi:hypothetical protein
MIKMKKCYIAHTMELRDFVEKNIIPQLEKHFEVINPFSKIRLKEFKGLSLKEIEDLVIHQKKSPRYVVQHDLNKLYKCDCLFAYIIKPSHGTDFEMWEAFKMNIPIAIAVLNPTSLKHPWLRHISISLGLHKEIPTIIRNLDEFFED